MNDPILEGDDEPVIEAPRWPTPGQKIDITIAVGISGNVLVIDAPEEFYNVTEGDTPDMHFEDIEAVYTPGVYRVQAEFEVHNYFDGEVGEYFFWLCTTEEGPTPDQIVYRPQ